MDVLSGVLEFVVKNILAPAVAVSATDGVVLKVPPVVSALTVGATIGVDAGAGAGVFEPPPPHPRMKRAAVASPISFNNVMMGTFITWPSNSALLLLATIWFVLKSTQDREF